MTAITWSPQLHQVIGELKKNPAQKIVNLISDPKWVNLNKLSLKEEHALRHAITGKYHSVNTVGIWF